MTDIELPTPVRRLLLDAELEVDAPDERRIFTNRDLNLDKIGLIGFDMDYTLAIYRQDAIERVSIEATVDKLVARGYPDKLLSADHEPSFAIRGLTVDKTHGNILKLDRHGYVGRGYHGRRPLTSEERRTTYREQRLGYEDDRFAPVDTLFALPEVTLFAVVVDMIDAHPDLFAGRPPSYAEAYQDVRDCIDHSHRDGSIKELIKANPEAYIERDPDLPKTLHKLRSAGKRLFLLTNSFFPYSDAVMRYLLDGALPSYPDWTAYFDWTVVGACKPAFFTENNPFQELDRGGDQVGPPRQQVQRGKLYQGGNQQGLQASFDAFADEVLYVGDHIYGDIVRSKKSSGWRTALVVQELYQELAVRRARGMTLREIESLHRLRTEIAEEISGQRNLAHGLARITAEDLLETGVPDLEQAKALLDSVRTRVKRRSDRLRRYEQETSDTVGRRAQEVDEAFNPYWGSSFAERLDTSRFGAQVEAFACIYTSRVSNLWFVSPSRYFISPHGSLPHWL